MSTAENILAATEAALLESDPGSLRVDRIAQAAGVNKRMIYHYFGDRGGLLQAVYARQLQRLLAPQAALAEGSKTVIVALLGEHAERLLEMAAVTDQEHLTPKLLQRAARVLLPLLLNDASSKHAAAEEAVAAAAWVSFCVDILSLALAQRAPVTFPDEPGTQGFVSVSERLLSRQKRRLRMTPDSRSHLSMKAG